jgi:O-antigen/teichoic acid export membrane protein
MRSRSFLAGLGFGYVNTILVVFAGLWLTPFLLHRLGQDRYGLWLLGAQVLMYLGLMDLGVVALLPRSVAYATGRAGGYREARDLPVLIEHTAGLVLWQTPFVAAAALALWLLIPDGWSALTWPLGLVVVFFVLMFPLRLLQALLQGLQDLSFVGAVQLCSWMAGTVLMATLVWLGWGLQSLAAGWIATQLLSAALFFWRLRSRFADVLPKSIPHISMNVARQQLGKGVSISVSQVAQVLLSGTDLLIIGRALGPFAVVPYACTGKLVTLLANQPSMLMQMAEPALSELRAGSSRERVFSASTALSQMVLLGSGAVSCVVLAVNQGFVSWWVGGERFGGSLLTVLMLANMLLRHLNVTASYTLFCFGYERRLAIVGVVDGAVTVALSLIFVHVLGAPGAVLGSIAGVVLVGLPANLHALAREDQVTVTDVLAPLTPWFWRFALLACAAAGSSILWVPSAFWTLAMTGALVGAAYLLVMLPLLSHPPLGDYVAPRIGTILARFSRGARRPAVSEPAA